MTDEWAETDSWPSPQITPPPAQDRTESDARAENADQPTGDAEKARETRYAEALTRHRVEVVMVAEHSFGWQCPTLRALDSARVGAGSGTLPVADRQADPAADTQPEGAVSVPLRWVDEVAIALDSASIIGARSCRPGDGLHIANHDRLIREAQQWSVYARSAKSVAPTAGSKVDTAPDPELFTEDGHLRGNAALVIADRYAEGQRGKVDTAPEAKDPPDTSWVTEVDAS